MKYPEIEKILRGYTGADYEGDVNQELAQAGATVRIDTDRTVITLAERQATTVGETPASANGVGLLDDGIHLQKIFVRGGYLAQPVNEILADGSVSMEALVYIGGKTYAVRGRQLVTKD